VKVLIRPQPYVRTNRWNAISERVRLIIVRAEPHKLIRVCDLSAFGEDAPPSKLL